MGVYARWLVLVFALLVGGAALAQEPKGWLGADVRDVSKAEADKLGWDSPHGAKLGALRPGSPAEAAGLKAGDIVLSVDGVEVETGTALTSAIEAKRPGAQLRLRVLSAGRERRVTATLAEPPKVQAAGERAVPQLMLDTGGHMALIRGLVFTPDGKQIVSASDDKVVRVWDWQAGRTVRTIRGQVGPGHEGKAIAMALSPDGRWLAVGGFMAPGFGIRDDAVGDIRLYDFATGRLVALLNGHTNALNFLTFSPDGKHLLSTSADRTGILWDVQSRALLYRLKGHKETVLAAAFTPDGERVVTGSYDTTLKLWSVRDGTEMATMAGHKELVRSVGVSPVDDIIASGGRGDEGEIRLWDSTTGHYLRTLGKQGSWVGTLSFSPDGKWLVSTCAGGPSCATQPQIVWDVASGRRLQEPRHHDNTAVAAVSPDGRLVASGGGSNRAIVIWDPKTSEVKHKLAGAGASNWAAAFSADGRRIAWGNTWRTHSANAANPLEFQLRLAAVGQTLGRPEPVSADAASTFVRARAKHGAYALVHRKAGNLGFDAILEVKKDDQKLLTIERGTTNGYQHRTYSFTPDGQTILSAGDHGVLTAYNLRGQRLGNYVGHDGDIWAVTPSPDGRLLVSGSADQTVRLWNLKTRELIVTLFPGTDGEWVMWTPQGYYTGSPGADKIVGWQINKGPDQAADYVGADQLRQHLNRPDIVERAIILASAEQAVREAPGTSFTLADLLARPVPRFRILGPPAGSTLRGGRMTVNIAVDPTPDPIKAIRVQVNGRQVAELTPETGSGGFSPGERSLDVPLGKGRNEVRITLTNAIGEKAETLTLTHDGEGALDKRGTLYLLAIGVDKYPGLGKTCGAQGNASCDLRFSGADARALVSAVEKRLGPAHASVVKRVLVNGAAAKDVPTASNIVDAIDLLKQAKETDTVLLFIAGHGVNDGPNYRFLPTNAEKAGGALRGSTVVPWHALQEAVEAAKGRRILFIDTCHAGNAYNQRLGNAAYHANIIAYTAARFDQEAMEDANLGHGLFTYAVTEVLDGKAGFGAKRQISTKELADYLVKRVDQLAKALNGEQEPQYFKGRDAEDYVLAQW